MGLLSRKPRRLLPEDVVSMMERVGRAEIDPRGHGGGHIWVECLQPLSGTAQTDPDAFVSALAAECLPAGGWAVYGAQSTIKDLCAPTPDVPDATRILDAAIQFLRDNYVPPMRVPTYMWHHFCDNGGSADTWLTLRRPPTREQVRLTPFGPGETRRLVKMDARPDANIVLARQEHDGFVALIDAAWSDDDPTRSQQVWKQAATQYELYVDVAWSCQVWDWADAELEPFFPTPKALI